MNYKFDFKDIQRVDKRIARTLYEKGVDVLFLPCKINPERDIWNLGIWENKDLEGQYECFDILVSYYSAYNCDSHLGRYVSFYVKKEVLQDWKIG